MKNKKPVNCSSPRILFVDIETAPSLGWAWAKWETNIIENVKEWYVLCYAYKWLGEPSVHAKSLAHYKNYCKGSDDDSQLITDLHKLFDEADIIIAHNGDSFDIKKSNARFLINGLNPPKPYKTIDTKKVAKRYFKFDSNKLDDLGKYLGLGQKINTGGFELWKGCMAGDKDSWSKMVKYNKQDIVLLEKVYNKLLPWINNYPIVSEYNGTCRKCGNISFMSRGWSYTNTNKKRRWQCKRCNSWSLGLPEKITTENDNKI